MREITYLQAIREGFAAGMRKDKTSFIVGEGIAERGGCFGHTQGLLKEFGPERVLDTPISESAFTGMCAAAAACGSRSIVDIMYLDFTLVAMDQIVNQVAKLRYMSGGQCKMPMTINGVFGGIRSGGAHHSQTLYPLFANIPGIKIVLPSTAYDVKGLLASAIMDDNLVMVLEHRALLNIKGDVPEEDYFIPLGEASIVKKGTDVTIVGLSFMVHHALRAAEILEKDGVSAEVIDPRTLVPFDKGTVIESVKKTGRMVVVDEAYAPCSFASEIIAIVQEEALDFLNAPIKRINTLSAPIPFSPPLENYILPNPEKIVAAVKAIM